MSSFNIKEPNSEIHLSQLIENVIIQIKDDNLKCTINNIFNYLKQKYSDHVVVQALGVKELMKQVELGIRDGKIVRTFRSSDVNTAKCDTPQFLNPLSRPTNEAFRLPNMRLVRDKDDGMIADLAQYYSIISGIVTVLIKTVFSLSKESASSLNEICKHLYENYQFVTIDNQSNEIASAQNDEDNMERLKTCVKYLFGKHADIFIVKSDAELADEQIFFHADDKRKYALNLLHVEQLINREGNKSALHVASAAVEVVEVASPANPLKHE
jgi:hypothetical protein